MIMKILVVSEAHFLNTGYAIYYKNICEALHKAGHKVTELASYGNENDPEHVDHAKKCPWDVFLNIPHVQDKEMWAAYNESKKVRFDADFCSWNFENIVLRCMPDVVIAIRDHWYDKFILDSPLAKYYKVILSPTIDSRPQRFDWLYTFGQVDALTFYTKWSEDWAKTQFGQDNIVEHIPVAPAPSFKLINQKICRSKLGLPPNNKILLTIMRNQGRKHYPYLFEAFSELEDKSTLLYCHTHFEDKGWDIPKLILRNGIANRVYFTYKCSACSDISSDILKSDNKCKKCRARKNICSVQDGVTTEDLNFVYNSADLYVQWHSSEGFGIPQVEAAACGLKVITVNYSAAEDIVTKINSFPIEPLTLQTEMGTLCKRAIPNNEKLVELLNDESSWIYNREENVAKLKSNYDWEKTGASWVKLVESLKPKNNWADSPLLVEPPSFDKIKDLSNYNFVMACILNVTQDESLLGSAIHCESIEHLENGKFVPEDRISGMKGNIEKQVTKEMVYNKYLSLLNERVKWERNKNKSLSHQN